MAKKRTVKYFKNKNGFTLKSNRRKVVEPNTIMTDTELHNQVSCDFFEMVECDATGIVIDPTIIKINPDKVINVIEAAENETL